MCDDADSRSECSSDMNIDFQLARRIPSRLISGDAIESFSKLDIAPFGLTVFRGYDQNDQRDRSLINHMVGAILNLDRKNQIASYEALKQAGVWEILRPIIESRPSHAYAPDYVDLLNLYSYIRANRSRQVLEFGSGLSTIVMACALSHNGSGMLYSIEPSDKWASETRKMLPPELAPCCSVEYSPPADVEIRGVRTVRFAEVPDITPDFIYLDGAPKGSVFNGAEEIYLLEDKLPSGAAVIIDGRFKALRFFLDGHLKRKWEIITQTVAAETANNKLGVPANLDQFSNTLCTLLG